MPGARARASRADRGVPTLGGTTGLPKVAPRQHEEYVYNSRAWAEALDWGPDTRILYPLPVMHNAGIALAVQPALLSGATLILAPSASVPELLDLIGSERPTSMPLVPPALAVRMLEEPRSRQTDLSSIEQFLVGGQALPTGVSERLRDELGIAVRQMFGMAEGMFLLTPGDATEDVRHHTVGAPISPADEVRITEVGSDDPAPVGEIGEFCARGPYTIRGYYRAEQHNQSAFSPDGFYRSGDLARAHDVDGVLMYSIEGRIKDVINRGVEKIHAEEVEEVILRHPDVVNAALVAMPDPVLGERGCAYLIIEPGAAEPTVASLGEFLLGHGLAKYKLPERVEIVPEFPLSNVGKVSKKHLRERIAAALRDDSPTSGAR
ncbi:AMP-binding protein [Dietzia aerolata]|uniref:AMP-binding protein n=1 Tax=Dietzia aerolata TaxID=595984 RepID=UPI00362F56F3